MYEEMHSLVTVVYITDVVHCEKMTIYALDIMGELSALSCIQICQRETEHGEEAPNDSWDSGSIPDNSTKTLLVFQGGFLFFVKRDAKKNQE